MNKKTDMKFVGLLSLFFLSFLIFISIVIFNKPLTQLTRASGDVTPDGKSSIILAWPMTVPADGTTTSTINVFVRSITEKPVANRKITLKTTLGTISEKVIEADEKKLGKATFTITSQSPGVAEVTAFIDETLQIEKKVTIKFE